MSKKHIIAIKIGCLVPELLGHKVSERLAIFVGFFLQCLTCNISRMTKSDENSLFMNYVQAFKYFSIITFVLFQISSHKVEALN